MFRLNCNVTVRLISYFIFNKSEIQRGHAATHAVLFSGNNYLISLSNMESNT